MNEAAHQCAAVPIVPTVQPLRGACPEYSRRVQTPSLVLPRVAGEDLRTRLNQFLVNHERIVAVSNRRHSGLDPVLFALLQEHPANFRILILVFDQCAAFA